MLDLDSRLSVGEASRQLAISPQHLRRLIHAGRIPAVRTSIGFLVDPDDIARHKIRREALQAARR